MLSNAGSAQPSFYGSGDAFGRLLVNVRMQHSDEGQITVTFGKIEAVADDEKVGYFKSDIIRLDVLNAAGGFVEQHAGLDPARFERAQFFEHAGQGFAGIEDI